MDIYSAVMKAADHIERNPQDFNYDAVTLPGVPRSLDRTPDNCGCAIGWIMHMAGVKRTPFFGFSEFAGALNAGSPPEFYVRMSGFAPGWERDASLCAKGLRLYAQKYLTPPKTRRADV